MPPLPFRYEPATPVPPALLAARVGIEDVLDGLLTIQDLSLSRPWRWRGEEGEADVRYGLYRAYEVLEGAAAVAGESLARRGHTRTRASRILGQAVEALCDTHGLLLPLAEDDLDRDPGGGEWTLRQVLGHMLSAQRTYSLRTAYAVLRARHDPSLPLAAGAAEIGPIPTAADEGRGTLREVRRRLDALMDLGIGLLAGLDDASDLTAPTVWSGYAVDVRFRLHRWASHLREHTIQLEKTLALLGRAPTEVGRTVRVLMGAYGRLEGVCIGVPADVLVASSDGRRSVEAILARTTEEIRVLADEVRAAA